jgi:acetylornithine deacetylase
MRDVVGCLMELLAIPSVSGHERAVAACVAELLAAAVPGARVDVQDLNDGGANVLMRRGDPAVVLSSHLDTVPGKIEPRVAAGAVWGRGACDAKGQIAAQVCALACAAARGVHDLGCFFVSGEEVDSRGALAALEHPFVRGGAVVNGEPTGLRYVTRAWGVAEFELRAHGRAAHSSLSGGVAATHALVRDLHALLDLERDGRRVNVGVVEGGVASNVTAAGANALVGVRFRDGAEHLLDDVRRAVRRCDLEVRQIIEPAAFAAPAGAATVEVAFCSDAALYRRRFERVMQIGPGDIAHAHTDGERVTVADLHAAVDVLADLLGAQA